MGWTYVGKSFVVNEVRKLFSLSHLDEKFLGCEKKKNTLQKRENN